MMLMVMMMMMMMMLMVMMMMMMMMMMMIPTEGTASITIFAKTFSNGPGAPNEVPL